MDWDMKTAKDIMVPAVISVSSGTLLADAVELLVESGVGSLPVVDDDGRLVGIISESDRLEVLKNSSTLDENARVGEYMTCGVITVDQHANLNQIADLMMRVRIRRIPVVEGGQVVGVVSRTNLVRALHGMSSEPSATV